MISTLGLDTCCKNSSVSLVSSEGKLVKVNKYFLLLYNGFYNRLLSQLDMDDVTILFDDVSFSDLLSFQENVHGKHLTCVETADHKVNKTVIKNIKNDISLDCEKNVNTKVENNEGEKYAL